MPHHPSDTYIFSQEKSKVNKTYRYRGCVLQPGLGDSTGEGISWVPTLSPFCIQLQLHLPCDLFHQQIFKIILSSLNIQCVVSHSVYEKHFKPWTDEWLHDKWMKHRPLTAWSCLHALDCLAMIPLSWDMSSCTPSSSLHVSCSPRPLRHFMGHALPTLLSLTSLASLPSPEKHPWTSAWVRQHLFLLEMPELLCFKVPLTLSTCPAL